MNVKSTISLMSVCALLAATAGCTTTHAPANPNATPEARALLSYIYTISGQHTMTGQHNYPNTKDQSTVAASRYRGKVPAIFGQDFGFAKDGDKDAASARPDMIAEVKRQFERGSIIALCWHAVPPTADEPVVFRPPNRTNTNDHSVQGQLTDQQFLDILTPGTELYKKWCAQVDVIAGYLKQLQDAHIPVLWRPYHEMNGDWFWWGGRLGEHGTAALYRQLYDRFVNYHQLNNLVWIWSLDRPGTNSSRAFANFYPGAKYFDIAALDCYGPFEQHYYDDLLKVARGKPITLAEVGTPPSLEVLEKQPRWTWWMTWAGMGSGRRRGPGTNSVASASTNTGPNPVKVLVDDPRSWSLSDEAYRKAIEPIRVAAGYPPEVPAPEIPPPPAARPASP
jgi:mannan endo-1,4-beta-mannosidase